MRVCLLFFLIFFINSPLFNDFLFFYLLSLVAVLAYSARIPFVFVLKRSLVFIPFVLIVGLSLAARAYSGGLKTFTEILCKSYLSIVCIIVFLSSIPFMDLLKSLQTLKVPRLFVILLSFMYRYIFIFTDELLKSLMVKELRAQRQSRLLDLKTFSYLIGGLFLRSYDRAERVYSAMNLRGFDGTVRTLAPRQAIGVKDLFFALFVVLSVVGVSFL